MTSILRVLALVAVLLATSCHAAIAFYCNTTRANCATCTGRTLLASTQTVTIDFSGCKGSEISWACCLSTGCRAVFCDGEAVDTTKCEGTLNQTYVISADATDITIQYHDGVLCGDVVCGGGRGAGTGSCCGGSGGSSGCISEVCQKVIPLSTCPAAVRPECTSDAECPQPGPEFPCASSVCVNQKCSISYKAPETVCRPAAGVCDVAEYCTGETGSCPPDTKLAATTVCRAAAGACDAAEQCTGVSNDCPEDLYFDTSRQCRASAGICDVDEYCTGVSVDCPADAFKPQAEVCRTSAGICDVVEHCTGTSAVCPTDQFLPASTKCRASAGCCDSAEFCTGSSAFCPADTKEPDTKVCRKAVVGSDGTTCDVPEFCDGVSNDCPTDVFKVQGTQCRAAADLCDVPETCSGSSSACGGNLRNDRGFTMKCGTACYVCGAPQSQVGYNAKQKVSVIGGCTIGNCLSIASLEWPACATQCIANKCVNQKGLSNSAILQCSKDSGLFDCVGKVEGDAVLDGVCVTDGWFPVQLPQQPLTVPNTECALPLNSLAAAANKVLPARQDSSATQAPSSSSSSSGSNAPIIAFVGVAVVGVVAIAAVAAMLVISRTSLRHAAEAQVAAGTSDAPVQSAPAWAKTSGRGSPQWAEESVSLVHVPNPVRNPPATTPA